MGSWVAHELLAGGGHLFPVPRHPVCPRSTQAWGHWVASRAATASGMVGTHQQGIEGELRGPAGGGKPRSPGAARPVCERQAPAAPSARCCLRLWGGGSRRTGEHAEGERQSLPVLPPAGKCQGRCHGSDFLEGLCPIGSSPVSLKRQLSSEVPLSLLGWAVPGPTGNWLSSRTPVPGEGTLQACLSGPLP